MNGLIKAIGLGVIRNAATAGGGWLVAHGYMAANQTDGFLGSVLFLAGLGFTVYDKIVVKKKIAIAASNPTSPVAVAALK
jgi:hypothetical protein